MRPRRWLTLLCACSPVANTAAPPPPHCSGIWTGGAPHWKTADSWCSYPIPDREAILSLLAGHTVTFVGDSITRGFVATMALWLNECDVVAGNATADPRAAACRQATHLWSTKHLQKTELTIAGGLAEGGAVLRFFRLEQLRALSANAWFTAVLRGETDAGSAIVLNAGLWNLRRDFNTSSPSVAVNNYLREVAALLHLVATSPVAVSLRRRLFWRSLLPLEPLKNVTRGAFTPAAVREVNPTVSAMFSGAGYRVIDVYQYGVHEKSAALAAAPLHGAAALRMTVDGIHFRANVYRAMAPEIFSALSPVLRGWDAINRAPVDPHFGIYSGARGGIHISVRVLGQWLLAALLSLAVAVGVYFRRRSGSRPLQWSCPWRRLSAPRTAPAE